MAPIVFDFGGVLFRWQPLELLQQVLPARAHDAASAGHWAAEVFQSFKVGGDWADFDRGTADEAAVAARIAARTGLQPAEVMALIDAVPAHLVPIDGTVRLLRRLKEKGHPLFYLSNMPAPYAATLERSHDFLRWFDGGIFSSRVQLIKPEPAVFDAAARHFNIQPAEAVFIDDVPINIAAAQALGWRGIRFESPSQCADALREMSVL